MIKPLVIRESHTFSCAATTGRVTAVSVLAKTRDNPRVMDVTTEQAKARGEHLTKAWSSGRDTGEH